MSIKVATDATVDRAQWLRPVAFELPAGMIGFPEATRLEVILNPEELPFMWLRCVDNHALNFIVIEPHALIQGYTIELSDDDAARLEIERPEDAYIFNVVNFKPDHPEAATVNLIGPVVVNRRTLKGRQMIIANYADYSARHPLIASGSAGQA
ncbi:MAG: flagellar assembly protein FliW [Opitutaceae bacterium]|nr:flagellar assembly protein FliW [Opitutaceae bacterium]